MKVYTDYDFWQRLSAEPESSKICKVYYDKPFNWKYMTRFVDLEFIEMFPDYDWDWHWLSQYANLNFLSMFMTKLTNCICFNKNITLKWLLILKSNFNINYYQTNFYKFMSLTSSAFCFHLRLTLNDIEYVPFKNWNYLTLNTSFTIDDIVNSNLPWNADYICGNSNFTLNDIKKYNIMITPEIAYNTSITIDEIKNEPILQPYLYELLLRSYMININDYWLINKLSEVSSLHHMTRGLPLDVIINLNLPIKKFWCCKYLFNITTKELKKFRTKKFDRWFWISFDNYVSSKLMREDISDLCYRYHYKPANFYNYLATSEYIEFNGCFVRFNH